MRRPDLDRTNVMAGILVVVSMGLLFARIDGIRITTADELHVMAAANDETIGQASRLLDLCIGRFYAVIKWPTLEFLLTGTSDVVLTGIRLAALLLCVGCAARFLGEALNRRAAFLFPGLACALFPVLVTYQPLFYNPLLWVGWAAIWAMGLCSLPTFDRGGGGLVAGFFGLALMSHELNAVFVVWPWIVRGLVAGKGFYGGFSKTTLLCFAVLAIYGAIALAVRQATAAFDINYGGGTLGFDGPAAGRAILVNSLGIWPGLELWMQPRWQEFGSTGWVTPAHLWERLWNQAGLLMLAMAAGVGILTQSYLHAQTPTATDGDSRRRLRLMGALTFMIFAPNLLLSLTGKYQRWADQQMWPYYYSWMSYLAIIMLIVVALDHLRVSTRGRSVTITGAVGLLTLVTIFSVAASSEAIEFFRSYRFDHSSNPPVGQSQ